NLGTSGRVDPASAARIGKIIGVNYIITGAVTEYGQSRSGGGGGGVNVGKVGYHSAVDIRMVDATTGRIVFADTASHSKSSVKVKIFGFGGGESFNEKLATETMREAIKKVAAKMDATKFKASSSRKPAPAKAKAAKPAGKAVIADVDGNIITLNKGKNAGFKMGQTVTISRQSKVIKDPSTGKVLKIKYKTVGKIKLSEVEEAYSEGTITDGSGFKVGDIIR
ncbi:MAG: penicillin-binding protein activator LpoB, partial [Deltaproteobacteria bacterium]|nr:penicillin-binding protein activator LpoB [Candidatus Tharpella aukensis]